jgi:hypothetical protein
MKQLLAKLSPTRTDRPVSHLRVWMYKSLVMSVCEQNSFGKRFKHFLSLSKQGERWPEPQGP